MQERHIYEQLAKKDDEDYSQYVPESYKITRTQARDNLF